MNYMLKLSSNETYTITVYAKNSAGMGSGAEIQWPLSGKPGTVVKHHPHCKLVSVYPCINMTISRVYRNTIMSG